MKRFNRDAGAPYLKFYQTTSTMRDSMSHSVYRFVLQIKRQYKDVIGWAVFVPIHLNNKTIMSRISGFFAIYFAII